MSLTTGVLSLVSKTQSSATVLCTAATGGSGPYTYQLYMSTVTGFSPGGGNLVSGATALQNTVSGLIPNTIYYFKMVSTDTGNSNVTVTSLELAVTTPVSTVSQNQFQQSPYIGMVDLALSQNTIAAQVDASQATALYPGMAVKMVDSAGGVPKVVGIAAASDNVLGFINYNIKNQSFTAGMPLELSLAGNCIYLYAVAAIARGAQVEVANVLTPAAVRTKTGSSGADIVGWAFDKATNPGDLIRVMLTSPTYTKA